MRISRTPHHLLRHPSGVYHFRLVVPQALRGSVGKRIVKVSLRTRSVVEARGYAYALSARYAAAFSTLRDGRMPKPDLESILRSLQGGEIRPYDIALPNGLRVQAEGAEDHARALEVLKVVMASPLPTMRPAPQAAVAAVPERPAGIALGEAARKYLLTLDGASLPDKTRTQKRAAVNGFAQWKGLKVVLAGVSRTDVSEWLQSLRTAGIATTTLANKSSYLKAFLEWAQSAGHFPPGDNPAAKQVKSTAREKRHRRKHGFRAFTAEEVLTIYSAEALATVNEQTQWGAWIGLYTGARVSEVGQLALNDVFEVDGVLCFRITDEGHGQSLKNDASARVIPVHPALLDLGLRERVAELRATGKTHLFPKAKAGSVNGMGNWLSKSFGRHLAACGVTAGEVGKIGFHSLRKTVIQALKTVGVAAEARAQFVGHELKDEHHASYGREFTPRELLEGVGQGAGKTVGIGAMRFEVPKVGSVNGKEID